MMFKHKKKAIVLFCIIAVLVFGLFSNQTLLLFFSQKVWQHKVNSIEKLKNCNLSGIELDIVYLANKNVFDVYHPPEKSQNLHLKNYLKALPKNITQLWLDFKNLNNTNAENSLRLLNQLVKEHELNKRNIVIESDQMALLSSFRKNGYQTSYYFPQGLSKSSNQNLQSKLMMIKKELKENKPTYISSKYDDYDLLKENFPEQKKLFWFNVYGDNNQLKVRFLLFKILLDENVDALLIP